MGTIFSYHAKDKNGEYKDGTIEAINQDDALNKLETQGLYVVSIKIITTDVEKPEIVERQPTTGLSLDEKKRILEEEKFRLEAQEKAKKELEAKKTSQVKSEIPRPQGSGLVFLNYFSSDCSLMYFSMASLVRPDPMLRTK